MRARARARARGCGWVCVCVCVCVRLWFCFLCFVCVCLSELTFVERRCSVEPREYIFCVCVPFCCSDGWKLHVQCQFHRHSHNTRQWTRRTNVTLHRRLWWAASVWNDSLSVLPYDHRRPVQLHCNFLTHLEQTSADVSGFKPKTMSECQNALVVRSTHGAFPLDDRPSENYPKTRFKRSTWGTPNNTLFRFNDSKNCPVWDTQIAPQQERFPI